MLTSKDTKRYHTLCRVKLEPYIPEITTLSFISPASIFPVFAPLLTLFISPSHSCGLFSNNLKFPYFTLCFTTPISDFFSPSLTFRLISQHHLTYRRSQISVRFLSSTTFSSATFSLPSLHLHPFLPLYLTSPLLLSPLFFSHSPFFSYPRCFFCQTI